MTSNRFCADCISILYSVISKALSASELCDTAVATLGKIYEFHCDHIDSPKVIIFQNVNTKWINSLPSIFGNFGITSLFI
jgi:hypothetical protein